MKRIQERLDRLYRGVDRRLRGWPTVLIRTGLAFNQDDGALVSRSIAYYALFSLFPLLLALVSLSSYVLASEDAQQLVLEAVERYLPVAADVVQENIDQILNERSTIGIIALVSLLWSASGVFSATYRAVNRAWGNPKSELFWAEKIYGLVVVLVLGLLLVATTLYTTFVSVVRSWQLPLFEGQPFGDPGPGWLRGWFSTLMPALVSVVTFTILYRTMPRDDVAWRDVWLGGLVAGLVWEVGRQVFTWYLANFARYSLIYGSLGAIIAYLLWAYLSAQIILLGAEFTAQHTAWRRAGRPIESRALSQWMNEWSK